MPDTKTYYEVLGLPRTAGDEEIRQAYRARARELHPDVSDEPEAEERFREVTATYSVLSKPSARFLYDRFGYRGRGQGGLEAGPHGAAARVLAEVEIDQIEADCGTRREVRLADEQECAVCGGRGAVAGTDVRKCANCHGIGRLRVSSGLGVGRLLRLVPCHDCNGLGQIFERRCPECRGTGRVTERRMLTVRIPAGVEDGTRLRVMGDVGGTGYARTNSEYYDGSGFVNTTNISKAADRTDYTATPSGAPSTSQILAEVAKVTNNNPVANAYYPVYSDQPRGRAGYCAWHSSGTINGIRVQFGFFFNLDGDPGCDPQAPTSLGHSQGLSALANVSGHELSEMLTDPQLNAWYDQRGAENSDKCARTFSGFVTIGGQSWKIQGNWSNAAANARTGYANVGCIQTS